MTELRDEAIRLYDAYAHEHLDRRRLLREMTTLAGSAAAAEGLIGAIAPSAAAAQMVPADDPRLISHREIIVAADRTSPASPMGSMSGYRSELAQNGRNRPFVMVIHENRGLTEHIKDVTRRLALAGFVAFAPDFLAKQGGTPSDPDEARRRIAELDLAQAVKEAVVVLEAVATQRRKRAKVGAVGFCWGGAFVNRLAVAAGPELHAGVSYYGPAPAPSEAAKVRASMMVHLAGNDQRVNATGLPWVEALRAAGKHVAGHVYPGADHAFNNDTSAERYDKGVAELAWRRTIAFLRRELDP